jgi:hypothetical protein
MQQVFHIFMSKDESDEAYHNMKELLLKEPLWRRQTAVFQSLFILMRLDKEMALMRTSPLMVCLHAADCDPNYLSRPPPTRGPRDDTGSTALHWLAEMADPEIYTTHEIQIILGQQLLEAGAEVNAVAGSGLGHVTPLHRACASDTVTNLSFIRLLLEHGANPNARTVPQGETPLMHSMECSMSAAKIPISNPPRVRHSWEESAPAFRSISSGSMDRGVPPPDY